MVRCVKDQFWSIITPMTDIQFKLRLPKALHAQLEAAAQLAERSVTAEIVARLEGTFPVSIHEKILELRREEVAELEHFINGVAAASAELKRRFADRPMPKDVEKTLENAELELATAKEELAVAQQRLAEAAKDEADWGKRYDALKKARTGRG